MVRYINLLVITAVILLFTTGCGGRSEYRRLVALEQVLEQNPDSVRSVLYSMDIPIDSRSKALYTVLKTQSDYKCYEPLDTDSLMLEATAYYKTNRKNYYAALAYYTLGCVYDEKGNDIAAIDAYLKAKDLFPDTLIRYYALVHQSIGTIYLNAIVLDEADYYLNRALNIAKYRDDKILIDNIGYNIAKLELYKGNYMLSDSLFSELLDSEVYRADAYFQKSKISYFYNTDYVSSMVLIDKHLEIDTTSYGLVTKGDIYMCLSQYDSAYYYYNMAISMGGLNTAAYCEIYNQLSIIEKHRGNSEQHYTYRDRYLELKDSLYERRGDKRLFSITNEYRLQAEQIKARNKIVIANMVVALLIVFIISAIIIVWLLVNRNKQIMQLNYKREIDSIVSNLKRERLIQNEKGTIVERSAVIKRYKELLDKCIEEFQKTSTYKVLLISYDNSVVSQIPDIKADIFRLFNPVVSFLNDEYPRLSEGESLTCILSAMNVSVKQIAIIGCVSPDAVYKQKYRLKSKLPLDVYELFFTSPDISPDKNIEGGCY